VCIRAHRDPERAREPKVREFEIVGAVDEQVLRFEVTVQDPVCMAVEQARGQLVGEFLREGVRNSSIKIAGKRGRVVKGRSREYGGRRE
jgi:hypothetical protein